jgi:Icc-related predicted phosphoesterase
VEQFMIASRRFHFLDFMRFRVHSVPIVGVSGALPIPLCSRIGWLEAQRLDRLAAQIDSQTVLVAHPPPWGIRDRVAGRWHAGSKGLRRLVENESPAVLVCGHIHEAAGVERLGQTTVVNCALGKQRQGAIIWYDGHSAPQVEML